MSKYIKQAAAVFIGVSFAFTFIWVIYTTIQNTSNINGVVNFLNSQIQASSKTAQTK